MSMYDEPLLDPLAALFRRSAPPPEPMTLSETRIEAQFTRSVAYVRMTRVFTNTSADLIESVLTVPLAHDCGVCSLVVEIDGIPYFALPRSSRAARRAHDRGVEEGRLAILCERLARNLLILVIAGLRPGAQVEVRLELAQRLTHAGPDSFKLSLPLSVDPASINRNLEFADQLVGTPHQHPAWLTVIGPGVAGVSLTGHGELALGVANVVPCSGALALCLAFSDGETAIRPPWATDVIDDGTSLVFIGSSGELPDLLPRLQKIALPTERSPAVQAGNVGQSINATLRDTSLLVRLWRWWLRLLRRS